MTTVSCFGVPSALLCVSASSQSIASNSLPPLPPVHRSKCQKFGPPSGPWPVQSWSHSVQSSSMTKYFSTRGTYTIVPDGSSDLLVANVIGSLYVPVPPAQLWSVGYEMPQP